MATKQLRRGGDINVRVERILEGQDAYGVRTCLGCRNAVVGPQPDRVSCTRGFWGQPFNLARVANNTLKVTQQAATCPEWTN